MYKSHCQPLLTYHILGSAVVGVDDCRGGDPGGAVNRYGEQVVVGTGVELQHLEYVFEVSVRIETQLQERVQDRESS